MVKQTPVDFGRLIAIEALAYQEIDLEKTPIIVPACGHMVLMATMDRLMGISNHYEISESGAPIAFRSESLPLAFHEIKSCTHCPGSLRDLHRYNRLVKRLTLDESTKKFIVHSNMALGPLATKLQHEEKRLSNTKAIRSAGRTVSKPKSDFTPPTLVRLGGPRGVLFHNISELTGLDPRCGSLLALHDQILKLMGIVRADEQPFADIQRFVAQRPQTRHRVSTLQTTTGLLTSILLLRCEYDILSEIIKMHREQVPWMKTQHHWLTVQLRLDLHFSRRDCYDLIKEADQKIDLRSKIEARVLYARFVALERIASIDPNQIERLLLQARQQLETSKRIAKTLSFQRQPDSRDEELNSQRLERALQKHSTCEGKTNVRCKVLDCTRLFAGAVFWRKHVENRHPQWYEKLKVSVSSNPFSMLGEIEEVEKMLQEGTVTRIVTSTERQAVYTAVAQDLENTGKWSYCVNMHAVCKLV